MGDFRRLIKEIQDVNEEIVAGDIATVDSKLNTKITRSLEKGKKCKRHKRFDCHECSKDYNEL